MNGWMNGTMNIVHNVIWITHSIESLKKWIKSQIEHEWIHWEDYLMNLSKIVL